MPGESPLKLSDDPAITGPPAEESPAWKPMALAGAVLLLALGIFIAITNRNGHDDSAIDPYAANIRLDDLKLSAVQNFVGDTVSYIDGQMTNAGGRRVVGASVEVTFHNAMGEVVQKETMPLLALDRSGTYPDPKELRLLPLAPGQKREFRLTFEHISTDWNRAAPDLRVLRIQLE